MASEFGKRVKQMDKSNGFRYFWVFVRHPRWRISELPWQQWTLVSEVVLEAGKQRLDKWSLMGRLGNKARSLITQCAAWMRPDIIYVKRPVYQCEPKAFVDDVVNAYQKLSEEKKSKCLEFLLKNHPVLLLHPYTKEWKAKLEEMELGCDAPEDDTADASVDDSGETEILDWIEDDEGGVDGEGITENDDDDDDDEEEEDYGDGSDDDRDRPLDMEDIGDNDEDTFTEEDGDEISWNEKLRKALGSGEAMEKLAKESLEFTSKLYMEHSMTGEGEGEQKQSSDGDETALRGKWAKVSPDEWKYAGIGPWKKKVKKSKLPPELFLRAAVRPFTYRNLVKEIVLTRHAILDGDIGRKV
ncbi:hypothetical protein K1719_039704 [Acacia pycnantha]|nr:hypothetical protein K1719_039704 [Acacia pycnantha]